VWAITDLVITEHVVLLAEPGAKQWLFSMMDSMNQEDLIRMLVTLWAIWHARRKAIHEEVFQSPRATSLFVDSFLQELNLLKDQKKEARTRGVVPAQSPRWISPPAGSCKINVDGAVAKTANRGAVGAVCRSEDGIYLGASAVVFEGVTIPACLEALACREALSLAADLHESIVMVATDCKEVIQGMEKKNLGIFSNVLRDIAAESRGRSVTFRHEGRGSNSEARTLA
jgi:ribonuclease HI